MTGLRLFTVLFSCLVIIAVIWLRPLQAEEMDMMEGNEELADGFNLGCGDCGTKCKSMCGSRRFRLCCLQYMKKRSGGTVMKRDFKHGVNNKKNIFSNINNSPQHDVVGLGDMLQPLDLIGFENARKVYGDEY